MARKASQGGGSWAFAEGLYERADPTFVREVRRLHDAERLGALAPRWYADARPEARRLLLDYLDQPLNAYRHGPLVKRLFKLAEEAEDDEVMGRFLVLFDRSVRRVDKSRQRRATIPVANKEEAVDLAERLRPQGVEVELVGGGKFRKRIESVSLAWTEDALVVPPGTTMGRPYYPRRLELPLGTPFAQLLRAEIPAAAREHPITEEQREE
jgi:hypothetical protein